MPASVRALLVETLNDDARWNAGAPLGTPVALTYSFMAERPVGVSWWETPDFRPFSAAERREVRRALATWSAVAGITFLEIPDSGTGGDIRFGFHGFTEADVRESAAYTYYPQRNGETGTSEAQGGDVYINALNRGDNANYTPGHYGYLVLVHEIGHALGLKHPFEGVERLPAAEDNSTHTVMSYTVHRPYPQAPRPLDVTAIRALYGTRSGSLRWSWDARQRRVIGQGSAGADWLSGTGVADVLSGGAGNDYLLGYEGDDSLSGGAGNDVLNGGAGDDVAVYSGLRSRYTVRTLDDGQVAVSGPDGSDTLSGIEFLRFGAAAPESVASLRNRAPRLEVPLADSSVLAGEPVYIAVGVASFSDPEGESLRFSVCTADGRAWPTWLAFDSAQAALWGTVPEGAGSVEIRVTASDSYGASASDSFCLRVEAAVYMVSARGTATMPKPTAFSVQAAAELRRFAAVLSRPATASLSLPAQNLGKGLPMPLVASSVSL